MPAHPIQFLHLGSSASYSISLSVQPRNETEEWMAMWVMIRRMKIT
jgi:hypothetical protein